MNKAQLIESLADRLGGRRAAQEAVEALVDTVQRAVAKGEKVAITGFGTWEKIERAARTARNPATGASVKVKKTSVPKFRAGAGFKTVVADPRKLPKVAKTAAAGSAASRGAAASNGASRTTARKTAGAAKTTGAAKTATKAATTRTAAKSTTAKSTASKSTTGRAAASKSTATKSAAKKAPASTTARKTSTRKAAGKKA